MTGETDLERMLSTLTVDRRPGTFAVVSSAHGDITPLDAVATIVEAEGTTVIVPFEAAVSAGFTPDFEAVWLTLSVHSSLLAVGLTAVVAERLAGRDIACNVVAGYFHDHLLVPVGRADEAVAALSPAH